MREQSHKHEMADALRGDFARLRARGVATTLEPAALEADGGGPSTSIAVASTPAPQPVPGLSAAATAPEPASGGAAEAGSAPSWLRRVLGR